MKVLIVDDEECLLRVLELHLKRWGAQVRIARDGGEAFALAIRDTPDLVLTDYQMPLTDGVMLATMLRAFPATALVPIVMLTARGHRVAEKVLNEIRIDALLPKPFSIREIRATLEKVLEKTGKCMVS